MQHTQTAPGMKISRIVPEHEARLFAKRALEGEFNFKATPVPEKWQWKNNRRASPISILAIDMKEGRAAVLWFIGSAYSPATMDILRSEVWATN